MIPHEFVPSSVRDLHGTEIDGVPVIWEPESTWVTDAPLAELVAPLHDGMNCPADLGAPCWHRYGADFVLPEPDQDGIRATCYARHTPDWPVPRF